MVKLNENLKQRRIGFFFLGVFLIIFVFYLLWDGWLYEWVEYGYAGANQHFDWNIFGDMQWEIVDEEQIYESTNNLHNLSYICWWTGLNSALALIFDNKWLRQGAMATLAFPVISLFSTINPLVAKDIFTMEIFHLHSYILQLMYDATHVAGVIMGVYIFYIAAKRDEEIDFKKIAPIFIFTWILFYISRFTLQKWPFWDPANELALIGTNQVNSMPFMFYGLEYGVVIVLLYGINFLVKTVNRRIPNPKLKTVFPFVLFAVLTVVFILANLIVLQDIPWMAFIQ